MPLIAGSSIGPYQVLSPLGSGGMGEVYRALDRNLKREVALKVLPDTLLYDADHLSRFRREARVLASLNHPNIAAIYGFESTSDIQALVLELAEGPTLAQRLSAPDKMTVKEVLSVAAQIAEALDAAHARGVIHRDLKPANIKITPDGRVKVLDFGLAKLIADAAHTVSTDLSEMPTITSAPTTAGILLGTPAYMSPEQARGLTLDNRTDIWSFGCVLFEMMSGVRAFAGATIADTLANVLERDPPWQTLPPHTPAAIRRILERCLEKDPRRRLHHMADIRIELEDTLKPVAPQAMKEPRTRRAMSKMLFAGTTIAVLLGVAIFLLHGKLPPPRLSALEYVPLTNFTDSAVQPSLSRDGRMLTFIRGNDTFTTAGEVYIKFLPDGEPVQLTHDAQDDSNTMSPKFSYDGTHITYTKTSSGTGWETWIVPTLGGEARRMLPNAAALTWLGDQRVLFSESKGKGILMGISTAREDGAEAREVYVPRAESGMAHRSYISPDGKSVLVSEMTVAEGGWQPCRLVPFDGGSVGRRVGPSNSQCTEAAWSPDGRWMYFAANTGSGYHLWRQSFPDGPAEQITNDATEEEGIAVTPDGKSIITSVGAHQSTIWIHENSRERQISAEGYAFVPSISSDGSKLFYLSRSHSSTQWISGDLWSADLSSGARTRVLTNFVMTYYNISHDGRRIIFTGEDSAGQSGVWLASLDGQFPPRLVSPGESQRAFFLPPGNILFQKKEGNDWFAYLAAEDGTNLRKALPKPVIFLFSVSPDGRWVVVDENGKLIAYSLSGESPRFLCACAETGGDQRGHTPPQASWSADGHILYLRGDVVRAGPKIFAIPLKDGEMFPPFPVSGIKHSEDVTRLAGVQILDNPEAFPGPNPSQYAFTRTTTLRNLYEIRLP